MAATHTALGHFGQAAAALEEGLVAMIAALQPSVVQVLAGRVGAGSGIIWDAGGLIITNHHVVARQESVQVLLHDGRQLSGAVVASDPTLDRALLRVAAADLPAARIGASSSLRVGEVVVAVGNPWGQRGVATLGIVSGVGEIAVPWRRARAEYIRSDVALAPGNSGGPLIDAGGAVVGINAMIFGGDLSVAIPAHIASQFVAVALAEGPTLGIAVQPIELPRSIRDAARVEQGLMVVGVQEGSLAAAAGMYVGDVLLEVFDKPLYDIHTLKYALIARQPGERLTLRLARGEQIQTVVV
jgi:serine protease Do